MAISIRVAIDKDAFSYALGLNSIKIKDIYEKSIAINGFRLPIEIIVVGNEGYAVLPFATGYTIATR